MDKKLTFELVKQIKSQFNLKKTLYINSSEFDLFKEIEKEADTRIYHNTEKKFSEDDVIGDPYNVLEDIKDKFDFIVGDCMSSEVFGQLIV